MTKYVIRSARTGLFLRVTLGSYVWRDEQSEATWYDSATMATMAAIAYGLADYEVVPIT